MDAVVFTAGVGENAAAIRAEVARQSAGPGLTLEAGANAAAGLRISVRERRVNAWVMRTNLELMVAPHVLALRITSGTERDSQ